MQTIMSNANYESFYDDYWLVTSSEPAADNITSVLVVMTTVVKATAMLAVVMATLLGNTLVIVGVWRSDKLRSSVANAFIVSLAGADLMVALLVMPFSAVQVRPNYTYTSLSRFRKKCPTFWRDQTVFHRLQNGGLRAGRQTIRVRSPDPQQPVNILIPHCQSLSQNIFPSPHSSIKIISHSSTHPC